MRYNFYDVILKTFGLSEPHILNRTSLFHYLVSMITIRESGLIVNGLWLPDTKPLELHVGCLSLPFMSHIIQQAEDIKEGEKVEHKLLLKCPHTSASLVVKSALSEEELVRFVREALKDLEQWQDEDLAGPEAESANSSEDLSADEEVEDSDSKSAKRYKSTKNTEHL